MSRTRYLRWPTATAIAVAVGAVCGPPAAGADTVAYLVNVTVRPGYHFVSADDALRYGRRICDRIAENRTYGQLVSDVKADLGTGDDHQASYLISQAANELCPQLIWTLRNSVTPTVDAAAPSGPS